MDYIITCITCIPSTFVNSFATSILIVQLTQSIFRPMYREYLLFENIINPIRTINTSFRLRNCIRRYIIASPSHPINRSPLKLPFGWNKNVAGKIIKCIIQNNINSMLYYKCYKLRYTRNVHFLYPLQTFTRTNFLSLYLNYSNSRETFF